MAQLHPTIKQLSVIVDPKPLGTEKSIHLLRVSGCDLAKVLGIAELRDVGRVRQFAIVSGRTEVELAKGNSSSVQASSICAGRY
jgi:hypothetical protein